MKEGVGQQKNHPRRAQDQGNHLGLVLRQHLHYKTIRKRENGLTIKSMYLQQHSC